MIRVHANSHSSGWGVKTFSACYLQGYHDPDTLFYRGSGALNQEWHWISVTFSCLTHLLHLNYSVDETTQHQSRRGSCTTRDSETVHFSLWINHVVCTRACICVRVWVCESVSRPGLSHGFWWTASVFAWLANWVTTGTDSLDTLGG